MPFLPSSSYTPSSRLSVAPPTLDQNADAAGAIVRQERGALATGAGIVGLAPIDLLDTVASSIPLVSRAAGIERGDINRAALQALDVPGLGDFYRDYKGGVEAASGIAGIVAAEVLTRKITKPAGMFMQTLQKLPYARRIATLDAEYANAMQTVRAVDSQLAASGALGAQQYVGRVVVDANMFDRATGGFVAASKEISRNRAVWNAKGLGALKGARDVAMTEATMAMTLNQNGFLYDDDMGHNLTWMAAGLGLGAAANVFSTAYQIRKFVNSDQIRRLQAGALDPGFVEESRIFAPKNKAANDFVPHFGGPISDKITSLQVNARILREEAIEGTGNAQMLASNRESLATQHMKLAREETQKLTMKGLNHNSRTRFSMNAPGYGNHIDLLVHRDPAALYGVEELGAIADDSTAFATHEARKNRLDERLSALDDELAEHLDDDLNLLADGDPDKVAELQTRARQLEYLRNMPPMVIIDGEWMPLSEAAAIEGFERPTIRFTKERVEGEVKGTIKDNRGLWEVESENPRGAISLDSDLVYHIPGARNIDTADYFDVLRLYSLGNKALDTMIHYRGTINLPRKPDWFQLDMAEQLLRMGEKQGKAPRVIFPEGMTRESAMIESLIQKSRAIKKWQIKENQTALKAAKKGETYEGRLSRLRVHYNLPRLTAAERGVLGTVEHPVERLVRGMAELSEEEIRKMTLPEIQQAVAEFKRLEDLAPAQRSDLDVLGNSFQYGVDESGRELKPILAYKRPYAPVEWTKEHMAERLAAGKLFTLGRLTEESAAPMTKAIVQTLTQSDDYHTAARSHELMDNQIQGSIAGLAPQNPFGAFGKSFVTADWRDRDNPIMLAASRFREAANRQVREVMQATIDAAFEGRLNLLANPRNASSKLLLDQLFTFRSGWDLGTEVIDRDGGRFKAFVLKQTDNNKERFRQQFGKEMPKGQTLLSPQGKEIVLDELGLDLFNRFNQVTTFTRREKNTLLRANGRGEIEHVDWFVPPPNTKGQFIGLVIGPDGKTVPGMGVVAQTQEQFAKGRADIEEQLAKLGIGYVFRTQDEIRDFASIWDRVQMDFVDPGTTAVQPNKRARGALVGQTHRVNAFEDALTWVRDQFTQHGNDIVETLMKESINAAKARANIATGVTRSARTRFGDSRLRSIYDFYIENLTGKSRLDPKGSFVGRMYTTIEDNLDKFLEAGTPPAARVWHATNEWIGKHLPWSKDEQARKDFDALTTQLGKYMPFESAAKMLEAEGAGAAPLTTKKITGALNSFSAAVLLRVAEVAHPIMNLSGILNASPAVIRHFTPNPGETIGDFANRVGHSAHIFELPNGKTIATLDMSKIAGRAFKKAWSRETHPDYAYMVRNGFLSQEVAEFHRQFGSIESKGSWERFFNGDPASNTAFGKKGLVGWASILSDKSEDFSRSWGHMIGLDIAEQLGIKSREARHAFAHDVANKMIANYSPHNRPEIFQGAIGAPIGLFQSFIWNYYERMFRYVENKNWKALGMQATTQASLFGVTSLPGWKEFNSLFMSESEGESDPTSGIWRKFGGGAGDLLAGGVISNIPKLFGAGAVDLYSRGDVSIRQFQIQDMDSISGILNSTVPAFNLLAKFKDGIQQGMQAFSDRNPTLTSTQLGEVMSNMIANRPIAGMLEQFLAGGNDTDRFGQLVTETQSMAESTYRLLGLRSMRQSKEVQAFYANKDAKERKAAADEILRVSTRAAIRAGKLNNLGPTFTQYLKNGGDPRHFRRWIRETYEAATETRSERQLEAALKNPNDMDEALRLIDAGVGVGADEATPDPMQYYGVSSGDSLDQDNLEPGVYPGQVNPVPTE